MPKGLDTLREAPKSTKEYLFPILPCVWPRDVLIMHAWIHCFDCIEKYWKLLVAILSVSIYHLPRPLLSPPGFAISYVISSIDLINYFDNSPDLHVRLSL
jgi:hypothetical protein